MGWFDGRSSSSSHSVRRRSPSRRSTHSASHSRHSAPSIFSMSGGLSGRGRSSPSVFSSASSSRRARPRQGFIKRIVHYIKRLLRDIYLYARHHPVKVFFLVVMPLITSGVLVKLLGMIGIRLPRGIFGNLAGSSPKTGYGSPGGNGVTESVTGLMNIAKMFI